MAKKKQNTSSFIGPSNKIKSPVMYPDEEWAKRPKIPLDSPYFKHESRGTKLSDMGKTPGVAEKGEKYNRTIDNYSNSVGGMSSIAMMEMRKRLEGQDSARVDFLNKNRKKIFDNEQKRRK